MACCGLCRPKVKSPAKPKKNLTMKKVNQIDLWISNIEGPYESIELPSKPPSKPMTITNKEEVTEAETNDQQDDISKSEYSSSNVSINEDEQSMNIIG